MKTIIEHMTTMIMMFILVFIFSAILTIGLQISNARLIHTSTIEKLQSSYYNIEIEELNAGLYEDWYFEIKEISNINTRRDFEVALNYNIKMPLMKKGISGRMVGYAR